MSQRNLQPIATQFVEVLFITLTKRNGAYYKRMWIDVEQFLDKLCKFLSVHIHAVRGYETKTDNAHEHIIIRVPADELDRFHKRIGRFKYHKAWSWVKHEDDFKMELKEQAYEYVLVKHTPVMPFQSRDMFCPGKYARCRKGNCEHISTP